MPKSRRANRSIDGKIVEETKRKKRQEKFAKKLRRQREGKKKRLAESNPHLTKAEINCRYKKSFDSHLEAYYVASRIMAKVRPYHCRLCQKWHLTSKVEVDYEFENRTGTDG